jgi:hypothetical protein
MPVMLAADDIDPWLCGNADHAGLAEDELAAL